MSYESTVLADSPTGYWRLGDVSGTTAPVDSSGNGHTGTVVGTPTFGSTGLLSGDPGTCMSLTGDGSCASVSVPGWSGTGDVTVEFWMQSVDTVDIQVIYNGAGDANWIGAENFLTLGLAYNSSVNVCDGSPHHCVVERRSGNIRVYVDGVLRNTPASLSGAIFPPSLIGKYGAGFPFTGKIQEVAVWDGTALSDARITAHFNAASGGGGTSFGITESDLPSNHNGNITVHAVGSGTTWSGSTAFTVSGVSGWSLASKTFVDTTHYTLVLTPPGAATPPAGATGTLTVTDTTDTLSATITIATPTLALSPSSGATGATPTLTISGTNTLWTVETAAGLFTETGGSGASIATPTVTTNTAATAVLTVGSATGSLTIKDTSTGATATFTASTGPVTVPINDPNLFWSPYNWFFSGTTYAQSNTPGAYLKMKFTGTSVALNVDVSPLTNASFDAGNYPTIMYSVDGNSYTRYQLTSSDTSISLATSLASGTHDVLIWFVTINLSTGGMNTGDRWTTPANVVRITGLTIDTAAATVSQTLLPKRLVVYGDSITEGADSLGGNLVSAANDASQTYGVLLGNFLNAEVGIIGFSAQAWGLGLGAYGNVPGLNTSWPLYSNGKSRLVSGLLSPAPDYCHINMGQNGGADTDVSSFLPALRTAAPGATIFIQVPFSGNDRAAVTNGFNEYQTATPDPKCFLIDLGTSLAETLANGRNSHDTIHPSAQGHATFAAMLMNAMAPDLSGGSAVFSPIGCGFIKGV